jgi:hypothetical protein
MTDDITTKTDLLAAIRRERQRLEAAIDALDADALVQPGVTGSWSIKDIMAHIVAWEQTMLGWYRAGSREDVPFTDEVVDAVNQQFYEEHRDRPLADVRAAFDASYRETLAAVEGMSQQELFTLEHFTWTGEHPLAMYVQANTHWHYAEHLEEITAWTQGQ